MKDIKSPAKQKCGGFGNYKLTYVKKEVFRLCTVLHAESTAVTISPRLRVTAMQNGKTRNNLSRIGWLVTLLASLYVCLLLAWDYTHGGVPVHHLMARKDLPGFSNWWGVLLIPILTGFLTFRIRKRVGDFRLPAFVIYTFAGALFYGATLCTFFLLDVSDVPFYMLIGLIALSFFFPIYRAEFFLGLVLGMTYAFGGVLPVIIVSILSLVGLLLYKVVRPAVLFIFQSLGLKRQ